MAAPGSLRSSSLLALSFGLGGCSTLLLPDAPMTRIGPHGPPVDLKGGETVVDGSFVATNQATEGIHGGRLMLRQAFTDDLSLRMEGFYQDSEVTREAIGGRAGLVFSPIPHFALHVGGGVGRGDGGSFAGPDIGVVLGYVNPHFIPYAGLRGALVTTFDEQRLRVTDSGDVADYDLQPSVNWRADLGFAVPLTRRQATEVALHTTFGIGMTHILGPNEAEITYGQNTDYAVGISPATSSPDLQLAVGLRVRFGDDSLREPY